MIREFEAVARGDTPRLMIQTPPGSAKSTYARLFTSWYMARGRKSVVGASHTQKLADDISRKTQALVRDNATTLDYRPVTEAADLWRTSNGCEYRAVGVGGAVTGFRADCLVASTIVETLDGPRSIQEIAEDTQTNVVLSYDERTKRAAWRPVIAAAKRHSSSHFKVTCASGRVVEATGNHRFYTSRGWIKGEKLASGDLLLQVVRKGSHPPSLRSAQGNPARRDRVLLQQAVLNQAGERTSGAQPAGLQAVRQADAERTEFGKRELFLLCGVPQSSSLRGRQVKKESPRKGLRVLQQGIPWPDDGAAGPVLQPCVQGQNACFRDAGRSQSSMEEWSKPAAAAETCGSGLSENQASDYRAGWLSLCSVQQHGPVGSSPYQHECCRQSLVELGDALPGVSHGMARWGEIETKEDVVVLVECLREPAEVYDIQVAGTHCFFANGILVHNCVVIDDPVKGYEEADSETNRETVWDWFNADLRTRLKPNAPIVLIMTRWHEDDIGGRLLETQGDLWRVFKLRAVADNDDPLGRSPGEWLWSDDDYHYADELRRVRSECEANGTTRHWSALFQQDPHPPGGAIFKVGFVTVVDLAPAIASVVRAWDLAGTADGGGRDPDWTCGVKLARLADGRYCVLDVVRQRGTPETVLALITATASRDGPQVPISLPQDPAQAGKFQARFFVRHLAGYDVHASKEADDRGKLVDKPARAAPVASQCNIGNLLLVRGAWNKPFLDELASFPSGKHDDQVDALSRAFQRVLPSLMQPERHGPPIAIFAR